MKRADVRYSVRHQPIMQALRKRLSYANVMATLAVFIALGGAGYAAVKVPKKSVGPAQLKASAVTNPKLANGAVSSAKLAPAAVGPGALAAGSVGAGALAAGSVGPGALAAGSVGAAALAPGSVSGSTLADGGVPGSAIVPGAITGSLLAPNSVSTSNIADGSVEPEDLEADQLPQSPTLLPCGGGNNWVKVATGLEPHYWMDKAGIVHLEGAVKCAVAPTSGEIFQMPFNYRPDQDVVRFAQLAGGLTLAQVAVIGEPITAGLIFDGGTSASSKDYVSLDGITYRGEGPVP